MKLNRLDWALVSVFALVLVGVLLVQSKVMVTSADMVEGEADVKIEIGVYGAEILDPSLIKAGEKTALSIRNQPRGDVLIDSVRYEPDQITFMLPSGQPKAVANVAQPHLTDVYITLKDHATVSKEGYVANGVKIKVGQPIDVEGFAYRFSGRILNVSAVKAESSKL